jgi:ferredoxin
MLAQLDVLQTTIVERRTSRDADLRSTIPPPAFLIPLLPLIRWLTPALIRFGKRVESQFEFYADSTCTGCGLCETICLADKIVLVDAKPSWPQASTCYSCFACLNYCPQQAIQVKSSWYLRSHTPENGRYHHPQITASDIAAQKAQRCEA